MKKLPTQLVSLWAITFQNLLPLPWVIVAILCCWVQAFPDTGPDGSSVAEPSHTNSTPASLQPPADAFVTRRFDWIPTIDKLRSMSPPFPATAPMQSISALVWHDDRLWMSANSRATATGQRSGSQLWDLSLKNNSLERILGILTEYQPRQLATRDQELWMSISGGIAAFDTRTFIVDTFNAQQGLSSTNIVGLAATEDHFLALSDTGVLFSLDSRGTNWNQLDVPAPVANPRSPDPWRGFATSGSWLLAWSKRAVVTRHFHANEWMDVTERLNRGNPREGTPTFQCAIGDGSGAFWIGSDAGLHRLLSETLTVENQLVPPGATARGGVLSPTGTPIPVTPSTLEAARQRVGLQIRSRLRDRARLIRASQESKSLVDLVTPTSRIPGAVLALLRDRAFLWVATTDGLNPQRGRILLYNLAVQKWMGWFSTSAPVSALSCNDRWLWAGLDVKSHAGTSPLLMVDKSTFLTIPQKRWVDPTLSPEELGNKLATLPLRERAVVAFFRGEADRVVELLSTDIDTENPESLFLLALAHDGLGLNKSDLFQKYLLQLHQVAPNSPFAMVTRSLLLSPTKPVDPLYDAKPIREPESLASQLARRDLNGDGLINAIELRLWMGEKVDLTKYDKSGDGKLDSKELESVIRDYPPAR